MIKNWKLFLESKDPFEGDPFREEILNNITDILSVIKDDGFKIFIDYGIDDVSVHPGTRPHNELRIKVISSDKSVFIKPDHFESISHLNSYLLSEGFEPISKNILKELDIIFHIPKKIRPGLVLSYPISRFEFSLKKSGDMKIDWINFSYKLPFSKWKGNYTSIK